MNNATLNARPFLNGVPTEPQARKLLERLRTMRDGEVLSFPEMERITGVDRQNSRNRFSAVTARARRLFADESSVWMVADPGVGWKRPTGDEQGEFHHRGARSGLRIFGRHGRRMASIAEARLTKEGKQRRDFMVGTMAYIEQVARGKLTIPEFSPTATTNR